MNKEISRIEYYVSGPNKIVAAILDNGMVDIQVVEKDVINAMRAHAVLSSIVLRKLADLCDNMKAKI